jgi:hypothetical protein
MLNINKRFEQLEEKQKFISSRFDFLENKYQNDSVGFFKELNNEQYNLQIGLDELFSKQENTQITKNYLNLYNSINNNKSISKVSILNKTQPKQISHNITPVNNFIVDSVIPLKEKIIQQQETKFEPQNQVVLTFEPIDKDDKEILMQNQNKIKLDIHKKQNNFLTNELVNLRIKLNKLKGKNKILNNLLKSNENVKNCKLMEKIIITYIEKLTVNWNEICDLVVDELIEEEVYNLNEIELNRIKHKTDYTISLVRESFKEEKYTHPREPLNEINSILSDFINKEDILVNKYLNKN